jgi:hypothetical protein
MCGKQRTLSPVNLDVWQRKGLRSDFSDVWQIQGLWEETERAQQGGTRARQEKRIGKDESALRQTRRRVAGIIRHVNYFIGTVRMRCGKSPMMGETNREWAPSGAQNPPLSHVVPRKPLPKTRLKPPHVSANGNSKIEIGNTKLKEGSERPTI